MEIYDMAKEDKSEKQPERLSSSNGAAADSSAAGGSSTAATGTAANASGTSSNVTKFRGKGRLCTGTRYGHLSNSEAAAYSAAAGGSSAAASNMRVSRISLLPTQTHRTRSSYIQAFIVDNILRPYNAGNSIDPENPNYAVRQVSRSTLLEEQRTGEDRATVQARFATTKPKILVLNYKSIVDILNVERNRILSTQSQIITQQIDSLKTWIIDLTLALETFNKTTLGALIPGGTQVRLYDTVVMSSAAIDSPSTLLFFKLALLKFRMECYCTLRELVNTNTADSTNVAFSTAEFDNAELQINAECELADCNKMMELGARIPEASSVALLGKASTLFYLERFPESIASFTELLDSKPRLEESALLEAHYKRGLACIKLGDTASLKMAQGDFDFLIRHDQTKLSYFGNRGMIYYHLARGLESTSPDYRRFLTQALNDLNSASVLQRSNPFSAEYQPKVQLLLRDLPPIDVDARQQENRALVDTKLREGRNALAQKQAERKTKREGRAAWLAQMEALARTKAAAASAAAASRDGAAPSGSEKTLGGKRTFSAMEEAGNPQDSTDGANPTTTASDSPSKPKRPKTS